MKTDDYKITDDSIMTLSIETLRFYYDNARMRLADYHQQARDTTDRGYKLVAIYASLLTLECAYLYTNWQINAACMSILSILLGTVIATGCILKVILPRLYIPLGRDLYELQPNEYASSFGKEVDSELQQKCILRDELNVIQGSIAVQKKFNDKRTRLFGISLIAILSGVMASAAVYLFMPLLFLSLQ